MVKVSIVIPVYNRKNFLTVCIKSLLAQSFEDFEICLVDDGSTDGTGLLCDELAEKDTRIRVLHVQNGGAAYALSVQWTGNYFSNRQGRNQRHAGAAGE